MNYCVHQSSCHNISGIWICPVQDAPGADLSTFAAVSRPTNEAVICWRQKIASKKTLDNRAFLLYGITDNKKDKCDDREKVPRVTFQRAAGLVQGSAKRKDVTGPRAFPLRLLLRRKRVSSPLPERRDSCGVPY